MTIEIYTPDQQINDVDARLFWAYCAGSTTPRGQYDETVELLVRNPVRENGRVSRTALRKAAAKHVKGTDLTVRKIVRIG